MRRILSFTATLFLISLVSLISLPKAHGQLNPVLCWGSNGFGELGIGTSAGNSVAKWLKRLIHRA